MSTLAAEFTRGAWSVYECVAADGTMLYAGMTGRGAGRLAEHTSKPWWSAVDYIYVFHFDSEAAARANEREVISTCRPLFNVSQRPVGGPAVVQTWHDLFDENARLRARLAELEPDAALDEARGQS